MTIQLAWNANAESLYLALRAVWILFAMLLSHRETIRRNEREGEEAAISFHQVDCVDLSFVKNELKIVITSERIDYIEYCKQ